MLRILACFFCFVAGWTFANIISCLKLKQAPDFPFDGRWVVCTTDNGRKILISASVPIVIKAPEEKPNDSH